LPPEKRSLIGAGMNELRGAGKAVARMAGAFPAQALSGLDGLSAMAGNLIFDKQADPAARVQNTQAALSLPMGDSRTEEVATNVAELPGKVIQKGADVSGDFAMDVTGNPAVATGVKTGIEGLATMVAPVGFRAAKGALPKGKPQPMPKQTPITGKMTDEQMRNAHVQTLLANNIPVPFAQRGKGFANKQAASVSRASDTVLGPSKMLDEQGSAFTSAVLKKVRVDAKRATPDVMNEVNGRISQQYDDLLSRPTRVDDQLVKELVDAQDQIRRELSDADAAPLLRQIEDIVNKTEAHNANPATAGPHMDLIDGRAQQATRASLNRMTQSQNPSVKHWAGELKEILDDGYERTASPADVQAMRQVRGDVQKVKQFENAIGPDGVISPHKLWQNLTRKNNKGQLIYARGDQSLVELARAAKEVLSERLGNSGTTQRGMDILKIREVIKRPLEALAEGTALASGRLAESGAGKGTVSNVHLQNLRNQLPVQLPRMNSAVPGAAAVSQPIIETEQERRRRLQAEALRQ
jgi:hypothetical protein